MKMHITYQWLTLVVLVYFPATHVVGAAPNSVDSLSRELEQVKTDSAKINLLTEMARQVPHGDSARAMALWKKVLTLSRESRDPLSEAKTYLNIGSWHYDHYRTEEAQRYNEIAQKMVKQDTSRSARILLAKSQINTANIFWQRNRIEEALRGYLEVIPLLTHLADTESLALVNTNIAILFSNQKQYHKSNQYFLESVQQYKRLLPDSHAEIADVYVMLSMNALNADTRSKAKGMMDLDSAFNHLQHVDRQHRVWADYYSMRGRYQLLTGDLNAAEQSFQQGLPIARLYNDTYTTSDILLHLSELYEQRGEFAKTRPLLDELLTIGQTNQVGTYQLKALRTLSRMEYRLKKPEAAYRYLTAYIELSDSLHYNEVTAKLHEMEEKYNLSEAENKLLVLQRENQQKDFALERNRLYIGLLIGIAVPLFICCILVFLLYRNKKKLLVQQQQIHAIDMERIEHLHRNSLLSALLEGQEKERERLARDLHDGLGGILSSIKMDLSRISTAMSADVAQRKGLAIVVNNLDDAVEELRGIAHSMMPSMLTNYGLAEALREYCDKLKRAGCPIFFQAFRYENSMEQPRQLLLYRIVQELVNNCVKHAHPKEILVQLQQTDEAITLTVEDDGVGFDTAEPYAGAGLRNVAMRVGLLHGTLEIRSDIGVGTTFTVECPITATNDTLRKVG
ncbi:sensor histidine kinase [Parapedobacter defluvii]|uniref:tetratricopeptide repeat-containing sensor histidine kinase n=1 Tax=Parapedobacter defluvii TaxID=2045106 RepID=UPI00333E9EAB